MKISIKVSLETDGDYKLNNNTDYHMEFDGTGYYHHFVFEPNTPKYNFEDEHDVEMTSAWRACRLLEKMICDIHVSYTHHYLIEDLYIMFNEAIENVGKYPVHFETSISGNYEGTYIEINCER